MAADDTEEVTTAMTALRSMVRALRISSRMIETKMGISGAQLFVLQQLAERPADSLNELSSRTATHQSSVSVVVRRLVERGLVARTSSPGDRRRVSLALTDAGHHLLAGAPVTVQVRLIAGARALSADQRRDLAALLSAWVRASGLEDGEPPMAFEEPGDATDE
jgi:DNA-binding MarR family transcriptional regulator